MAKTQLPRTLIQLTRHPMIWVAAALVSIGVIAGLVVQTELWEAYLYGEASIVLLSFCLLVIAVIALVRWFTHRKIGPVLRWSTVILSSSVASILLFLALAWRIHRWEVVSVESYVSRALPVLDQMKVKDGVYPQTLPEEVLGPPPECVRKYKYGWYESDGKTFRFEYDDSAAWMDDALILTDTDRSWHGEGFTD